MRRPSNLILGLILTATYAAAAHMGFRVAGFYAEQVTTVWPPTGLAIAALLLGGRRFWPAIWIGAFAANAMTTAPLWTALFIATGNTLEAVLAAWALSRVRGFDPSFRRTRDAVRFVLFAAIISTAVGASIGTITLCASGVKPWSLFGPLWSDWALGDSLGALVFAPLILTVARPAFPIEERHIQETAAISLFTFIVTEIVFGGWWFPQSSSHPLEFVIFPFVIAAAVRLGQPATSLVVLTASVVSIAHTVAGVGPFAMSSPHESLVLLQVFLGVHASSGVVLAATIAERRTAERRRSAAHGVGRALATAGSIEEAAPLILQSIGKWLGWRFAALWLIDEKAGRLTCIDVYARGEAAQNFGAVSRQGAYAKGEGMPGRIWALAEPLWIADFPTETAFGRAEAARAAGLHSAFGFPISVGPTILGVIEIFHGRVTPTDADLRATTSAVGDQIGQFIVRKQAEAAVRESDTKTRAILQTALDAIISIDHRGIITDFNSAAERTFGYQRADMLGRELTSLVIPQPLPESLRTGLTPFPETGAGPFIDRRVETTAIHADGHEFPVEVSITALATDGPPEFTGFVRDVSERRRSDAERRDLLIRERAARKDAEEANRAKDQFLATLSHELRTPLNAIVGWTRMLLDGSIAEKDTRRALEVIERNAQVQVQLVADLLDVSRIITGGLALDMRPVDLGGVVGAALETVRPAAQAKELTLRATLPSSAVVTLGDGARLQQVVWNLLSNAVKFTPKEGRVDIEIADAGTSVAIHVSDSGPGIPPDFLPHVFERFRQGDGSPTRQHGGLGLGLAIVRHLVELHGGTVKAHSAGEGQGARFSVELPRAAPAAIESGGSAGDTARRPAARIDGCRVLVVDDDDDARELAKRALTAAGAQVRTASSVPEALAAVHDEWPDVLLADLAMPEQDGFVLIREVRELEASRGRHLPAAAVTAYGREPDRRRALASGFLRHVAKPADPRTLVETVVALWRH